MGCFTQQRDLGGTDACAVFAANPANAHREGSCPIYLKMWDANADLSPQCLFTDYDQEASWYNVVNQFYGFGPFFCMVSIITLVVYFVTSSDSGSLVVDTLS